MSLIKVALLIQYLNRKAKILNHENWHLSLKYPSIWRFYKILKNPLNSKIYWILPASLWILHVVKFDTGSLSSLLWNSLTVITLNFICFTSHYIKLKIQTPQTYLIHFMLQPSLNHSEIIFSSQFNHILQATLRILTMCMIKFIIQNKDFSSNMTDIWSRYNLITHNTLT